MELPIGFCNEPRGWDETTRSVARRALRKARLYRAGAIVRLPDEAVLRRRVRLPLEAAENLREVLGFEMDRHTPFKAEQVYYDFRPTAHDRKNRSIYVDLAVVPRSYADRVLTRLRSWGPVACRLEAAEAAGVFNLLPEGLRPAPKRALATTAAALAVIGLVLLGARLYQPVLEREQILAGTEQQLARAREAAAEAERLEAQLAQREEQARFVRDRRQRSWTVVELLDEISRRLPDDSWLLRSTIVDDKVTLSGYSGAPSKLLPLLGASDKLRDVRFMGPVALDSRVGRERFNIHASLTPRSPE
ncbi:MAG TPA: PilN domain-containing protein [Kiloniellales bacterium]|nr:PilN domain-containing protein [Kiloniellales bacterium]